MSKFQKTSKFFFEHSAEAHPTPATDTLENRQNRFQKRPYNPEACSKGNAQAKEAATFFRCLAASEAGIYQRRVSACSF